MALVGYSRVSSDSQNDEVQIEALKKAKCKKVFSEKRSGASLSERPELKKCLEYLREGDTLVITRIDRLARSLRDLQNLVYELEESQISIKALEQPIDTSTAAGKAFLSMLGVFAEFETNIRRERQLEGIAKAKSKGKYKGRKPTALAKSDEVIQLINEGFTRKAVSEKLDIGIASVYRIIKNYLSQNPDTSLPGSKNTTKIAVLDVWLRVENNSKFVRGKKQSRDDIESYISSMYDMSKPHKDSWDYVVKIPYTSTEDLNDKVVDIIQESHSIADLRNGFVEISVYEETTEKSW